MAAARHQLINVSMTELAMTIRTRLECKIGCEVVELVDDIARSRFFYLKVTIYKLANSEIQEVCHLARPGRQLCDIMGNRLIGLDSGLYVFQTTQQNHNRRTQSTNHEQHFHYFDCNSYDSHIRRIYCTGNPYRRKTVFARLHVCRRSAQSRRVGQLRPRETNALRML